MLILLIRMLDISEKTIEKKWCVSSGENGGRLM